SVEGDRSFGCACQAGGFFFGSGDKWVVFVLYALHFGEGEAISNIEVMGKLKWGPFTLDGFLLEFSCAKFGQLAHKFDTGGDHFASHFVVGVVNSCHGVCSSTDYFSCLTSWLYKRSNSSWLLKCSTIVPLPLVLHL